MSRILKDKGMYVVGALRADKILGPFIGVTTIAAAGTLVVVSNAAVNLDKPVFLTGQSFTNAGTTASMNVDSVVDGVSFMIVAAPAVSSATPVGFMITSSLG